MYRFLGAAFAALSLFTASPAMGQTCPPVIQDYTCTTVTVFGQQFSVDHHEVDIAVAPMDTKLGVTSMVEVAYRTDDTDDWLDLTQAIEEATATVPGLIVQAQMYTDISSPQDVVTRSDVKAIGFKIRRLGKFYHRMYEYDTSSDTFVETTSFRDEITGPGTAAWSQDLQWYAFGSQIPSYSAVFTFAVNALSFSGASTHAYSGIPEVLGNDLDPGSGGVVDDPSCAGQGVEGCNSALYPRCKDSGDPTNPSGRTCVRAGGTCGVKALVVEQNLSVLNTELATMYTLRDRMLEVAAVRGHVAGYYAVGSVIDWSDSSEAADVLATFSPTMAGADKIVNGNPTDIIVPSALYTQLSSLLTDLTGRDPEVDSYIQDLQGDLSAAKGKTRSQFCTYFTGASDCGF